VDMGAVFEGGEDDDDESFGMNNESKTNLKKTKKRETLNPMAGLPGGPKRTSQPPPAPDKVPGDITPKTNPMARTSGVPMGVPPDANPAAGEGDAKPKRKMSAAMQARLSAFGQ
jgi:hypothetical protein